MSIEFHCHTLFSVDGRGTPEDAVDRAVEQGVQLLAITDHNTIDGFSRASKRAEKEGVRLLAGVEIDATWGDGRHHLLGLGFDPGNTRLRSILERNFTTYGSSFEVLLSHFSEFGYDLDRGELEAGLAERYPTHPAPVSNMWFARDVLLASGVFPDRDSFHEVVDAIRQKYPGEFQSSLGAAEEAVSAVHDAGGVILLAHVTEYRPNDPAGQRRLIEELMEGGVDGFELYHPRNVADVGFEKLEALADELGCLVSGGSDCHDACRQGAGGIGSMEVPGRVGKRVLEAIEARR